MPPNQLNAVMNLEKLLNWRYAVKKYTDAKVSQKKIDGIVNAINLSATSTGIQPFRLIVVENKETRKLLREGSFNAQIEEASHLLVFAAFENITQQHIDEYIRRIALVRELPMESLHGFKTTLENHFLSRTAEENFSWGAKQAYVGLGTGLIAAADLQVDATPMEGFDRVKFDDVLGLTERGLKSVVLMALGYRDEENDGFARLKKVRLPVEDFATIN